MGDGSAAPANTVIGLFRALVEADPTRPVLTYYDLRTGERTELSGATLDNWVSKTANLLVDGLGLGPGDTAAVWLPPHWQTAAVLLGCWSAGLAVAYGAPDGDDARVVFAATDVIAAAGDGPGEEADERYALGLAPLGRPLGQAPPGWVDYVVEVRGHADRYQGPSPSPGAPAWMGADRGPVTHAELCRQARDRAGALGIPPAGRVLVDGTGYTDPREWLLSPLAAGATTVLGLGFGHDAARVAELADTERAGTTLGPVAAR